MSKKSRKQKIGPYVASVLNQGEVVQYQGRVHFCFLMAMLPAFLLLEALCFYIFVINPSLEHEPIALGRGTTVVLFLLPLLLFFQPWLVARTTEIALTNLRLIVKTGIVTQMATEIPLYRLESISIHKDVMGTLIGYGSVAVRGVGGSAIVAPGIANPLSFKKAVYRFIEAARTEELQHNGRASA